ncbi:MAG: iron ABC transporter permease [Gammaproteobacteria bacterium]|jgi:iron complex transport system permease protein|nr:iron ABC transporter permease [Gammaproteobacteria bacterium]MBT4491777.1 iron ABC transporter permease [Gammaproteobacteria bacterium]
MRNAPLVLGLVTVSVTVLLAAILLGSTPLGLSAVINSLTGSGSPGDAVVLWEIRLPRALAAYVVGAVLGLSGAALQGLLRNPLAEPGILGVSATASLFATFTLYFGFSALSSLVLPLAAIAGALTATMFLALVAARINSVVTLILIGVGLSSFSGALMTLLMNLAPNPFSLSDMVNWMMGTVANRSFEDIAFAMPFLFVGAAMILLSGRDLSAFTLGEEAASGIGADLAKIRLKIVLGTGLCAGGAVAIAGTVGFVGIVAPHLVRPHVDHEPSATLVPSALLGGVILVLADIFIRLTPTTTELKLGVVAALVGAPVFVWIASQRMMGGNSYD